MHTSSVNTAAFIMLNFKNKSLTISDVIKFPRRYECMYYKIIKINLS